MRKLTKKIVNERIINRGLKLVGNYLGSEIKSTFQCSNNHQWESKPNNIIHLNNGCPVCSGNIRNYCIRCNFIQPMNTTPDMWKMLSELLEGEKLPQSLNDTIYALCEGKAIILGSNEDYFKFVQVMEIRRNKP